MTTKVTNVYNLKLTPSQFGQNSIVVNCSQYDSLFRIIQFNLYNGYAVYSIPEGSVVTIRGTKKDLTGFEYECDYSNNVVTFPLQQQITIFPGKVPAELRITNNGEIIGSWNFLFLVEESPLSDNTTISETQLPLLEQAIESAGRLNEAFDDITEFTDETYPNAVQAVQNEGATQVANVTNEGTTQKGLVTSEGTTQVANVQAKGTEVLDSIPSDYTELSGEVADLKSEINVVFDGGEKKATEVIPTVLVGKAINAVGNLIDVEGYNATDYVEMPNNTTHLSIHASFSANLGMAFYNSSEAPLLIINGYNISSYGGTDKSEPQTIVFAVPSDAKYIRATMRDYYYTEASDFDIFPIINFPSAYEEIGQLQSDVLNIASLKVGKNLVNPAKVVTGAIESNGSISTEGSYANYITSDYISISPSTSYTLSSYAISSLNVANGRKIYLLFDEDKNLISGTYTNQSGVTELGFNNANAHFVRVSTSNDCYLMVEQGARTSYVPYTETLELNPTLPLTDAMKTELTNILSGKKYVACGDSFTEYTSIIGESNVKNELTWDSALGVYKTYPWWIAKRNNMVLVNEAISGSTMTYIDGNHHEFSTANGRYTQIPNDADYITLKFGINDENNQVPIGSIDDAVNTTFYGAWNIVLEYLITNHPYAKIGIIVSNGSISQELINATVAVAEKWGIAYYNENSNDVPLLHRTTGRNACETAKALRLNQFKISNTDTHPNYLAQEFESTMIESFIKSL